MSIDIIGIDTIPEMDPYRRTSGTPTKTVLVLDPLAETIMVEQRSDSCQAGTSEVEWHGRIRILSILGHPLEDDLRQAILEAMPLFERVVGGYSEDWDQQQGNRVGTLTEDAREAWEEMEQALNYEGRQDGWSFWRCWDWTVNAPLAVDFAARINKGGVIDVDVEVMRLEEEAMSENIVLDGTRACVEQAIEQAIALTRETPVAVDEDE